MGGGAAMTERPGKLESPTRRTSTAATHGVDDGSSHHHNEQQQIKQHFFETLSSPVQFSVLAVGVFMFFGIHNYLQEAIMDIQNFRFGVMLGYLEVFGVTVCSFFEREFFARETQRVAPISAYPLLTICLLSSSSLSNLALNFINFPTKVVFRSCKLIPTMIVASMVHKKVFASVEYLFAVCICLGLVLFAVADWEVSPSSNPIGLVLVTLSVCADAVLPNLQERLFRMGSTRLEVTFYTNIFTLVAMTITTFLSGDLMGLIDFAQNSPDRTRLCRYILVYTFVAYIAISFHMVVVRRFGGVSAVLLATGRKGMTLILSFVLFPKKFSWLYVFGALMVLGGLMLSSLFQIHKKKDSSNNNTTAANLSPRRSDGVGDEKNGILMSPLLVADGSAESRRGKEEGTWANNAHTHQS